jgi:superfamily II DNA or RNA helicase
MKYLHEILSRVFDGESASDILEGLNEQERGHTGEALLRILVLHHIHPTNTLSSVIPYQSYPIGRRIEAITGISESLNIITEGLINAGGSDKIDVSWRDGDKRCVCTSKIGVKKIKSIKDLEIIPMIAEFTEAGGYTENGKPVARESVVPYSLVYNKDEVTSLAERSKASNKASKDNLNLLDISDLNRMCAVLRERIERCIPKTFESILSYLLSDEKPSLRLRFHQKLICSKAMKLIDSGEKTVLIGALPRSGKTWMGAFIAKQFKRVLVITTRPTETIISWNNVFKMHREFSDYSVQYLNSDTSSNIAPSNTRGDKIVAVASIQFFKEKKRVELIGLTWDIVLLDEIHSGGSTELSNAVLDTYIGPTPIRIMMTATYTKTVMYYTIPTKCCLFWDLEDTRLMRTWGEPEVFARLCEKYGDEDVIQAQIDTYKSGETDESIRMCYVNAPRLGILTNIMNPDIYDGLRIATDSPDNIYGFSMRSLFMTTKDGGAFQNQKEVDTFLALISGSDKMRHYKEGDMSMFARILRYWKTVGHRDSDEFMTQIWFLPSGVGQLLEHVKSAMISRINANSVLKHFNTLTLDAGMGDISKIVSRAVVDAKEGGKRGLILLTGDVGSLGVSIPEADVAFMLHDIESADKTYQQMLRVLTEMVNKKCGIVVDFNVWRVLTTLNAYATSRCGQADRSSTERIHWCVSNLIDIDPDLWMCKESPKTFSEEKIADELTKQWRKMLENTGTSLHTLARKQIDLGEDQKELDRIAKYMDGGSSKSTIEVNPDQEKLSPGIEVRSESSIVISEEDKDVDDDKTDDDEDVSIAKKANLNDVLARLIPEMSVLSGCGSDLLKAMESILGNTRQRDALNDFLNQLYS